MRSYQSILMQILKLGFNTVRLSFCNQMFLPSSNVTSVDYRYNPDLIGLTPLQCLDKVISYSESIGLRVILARFSAKQGQIAEPLWYLPNDKRYSEARFIADWVMLAARYVNTAVVAMDLWENPKGNATWGANSTRTDWNLAAEKTANAILAVNPNVLIIVEGIYWASDLSSVSTHPIKLMIPNRLVYSAHEIPSSCFNSSNSTDSVDSVALRSNWNTKYGFIAIQQIAPVFIGEFGTLNDFDWLLTFLNYTNGQYIEEGKSDLPARQQGMSWAFQGLGPYGACGGLLAEDWLTLQTDKVASLRPFLAPLLPWRNPNLPAEPVNVSYVVPQPSWQPTIAPSRPYFPYFHTSGNQIVDRSGNSIRISGVNW